MTHEQKEVLEAASIIMEVPVEIKEIISDWILLTYDLPTNEAGNKARYEFLKEAPRAGFAQHTESVYLAPWTEDASFAILKLAEVGKLFVWYTTVSDPEKARELTRHYDQEVLSWLDDLDARLERIWGHIDNRRFKLAGRMIERTLRMMKELGEVIERRGSARLREELDRLQKALVNMMVRVG
ncbi:MAG: hypothetical protein ABIH46_05730 [Chloroflexota bacterium]